MKNSVHCRILYSTIVILAISLVLTFVCWPSKSIAIGKPQYKLVHYGCDISRAQKALAQYSNQGWELAAVGDTACFFIFKK